LNCLFSTSGIKRKHIESENTFISPARRLRAMRRHAAAAAIAQHHINDENHDSSLASALFREDDLLKKLSYTAASSKAHLPLGQPLHHRVPLQTREEIEPEPVHVAVAPIMLPPAPVVSSAPSRQVVMATLVPDHCSSIEELPHSKKQRHARHRVDPDASQSTAVLEAICLSRCVLIDSHSRQATQPIYGRHSSMKSLSAAVAELVAAESAAPVKAADISVVIPHAVEHAPQSSPMASTDCDSPVFHLGSASPVVADEELVIDEAAIEVELAANPIGVVVNELSCGVSSSVYHGTGATLLPGVDSDSTEPEYTEPVPFQLDAALMRRCHTVVLPREQVPPLGSYPMVLQMVFA
jgi:hypothetical protein